MTTPGRRRSTMRPNFRWVNTTFGVVTQRCTQIAIMLAITIDAKLHGTAAHALELAKVVDSYAPDDAVDRIHTGTGSTANESCRVNAKTNWLMAAIGITSRANDLYSSRTNAMARSTIALAVRGDTSAAAELGIMEGYKPDTYGNGISDVYDAWYASVSDISSTVNCLSALAGHGSVLELGIGTGRIALPLADAGVDVWGVDASEQMVALLRDRSPSLADKTWIGDMGSIALPHNFPRQFSVVFVTFNTLCNLTTAATQSQCIQACAQLLAPDGRLVVECFVPAELAAVARSLTVKSVEIDRVILTASIAEPHTQSIVGHHIEITESGGVRLRPFALRYLTPNDVDTMAAAAGLKLEHRQADWLGGTFTIDSPVHVSTYCCDHDNQHSTVESDREPRPN